METHEVCLWLELAGLDSRRPDGGVDAYLDGLGFAPDTVSLFMWSPDFLHQHDGLAVDRAFPPDIGAYLDSQFDRPKHEGPPWRAFQLKRVVETFRARGVTTLFSIFPGSLGGKFHAEWIADHPEVAYVTVRGMGTGLPVIHPYKRLADGSFYEEFLVERALAVARDYGFDGWHLADGYNHPWLQLAHADYSDDMVGQWRAERGDGPGGREAACDGDADAREARARRIWREERLSWIDFHCRRFERYVGRIVDAFHADGRVVTANTCWTRDPVEAIYRYGVDYRAFVRRGVDRLVVETCGAGGEMLDELCGAHTAAPFFDVIRATALTTKAYAPEGRFLFNNCTQDATEGWSFLRHAPAFLEREILSYGTLGLYGRDGRPERCFGGLQVCLASGIEPHEWRWLREKWALAFGPRIDRLAGATLAWCDDAVAAEVARYATHRTAPTAAVLSHLLAAGAVVQGVARLEELDRIDTPVVAIHPGLWPPAARARLLAYDRAPVVCVGVLDEADEAVRPAAWAWGGDGLGIRYYGPALASPPPGPPPAPAAERLDAPEPRSFFHDLPMDTLGPEACAVVGALLNDAAGLPATMTPSDKPDTPYFRLGGMRLADGRWRVYFHNTRWRYALGDFITDRPVAGMEVVNGFWERPMPFTPRPDGRAGAFCPVRVPPKGVSVVDLEFCKVPV